MERTAKYFWPIKLILNNQSSFKNISEITYLKTHFEIYEYDLLKIFSEFPRIFFMAWNLLLPSAFSSLVCWFASPVMLMNTVAAMKAWLWCLLPIKINDSESLSCHHISHDLSTVETWTVSMCFHFTSPVHIAALVPQCLAYISVSLSVCTFWVSASVSLTIWLRRSLSLSHPRIISLFIFLPLLLSIYMYIRLPVCLSVFLSVYLSVFLSVRLRIWLTYELTDWLKWSSQNSKVTGGPWLRSGISIKRALIGD